MYAIAKTSKRTENIMGGYVCVQYCLFVPLYLGDPKFKRQVFVGPCYTLDGFCSLFNRLLSTESNTTNNHSMDCYVHIVYQPLLILPPPGLCEWCPLGHENSGFPDVLTAKSMVNRIPWSHAASPVSTGP